MSANNSNNEVCHTNSINDAVDPHANVLAQAEQIPVLESSQDLSDAVASDHASGMSKFALYRRRFLRNKAAVVGLGIFIFLVLLATIGPFISKWSFTYSDFSALCVPPDAQHWFGTNDSGGDLFAQTVHGLGRSLIIAVVASVAITVISALIGCTAAFFGGNAEKIMLTIIHFLMVVPSFLILALLVSSSGGNWIVLIVALIAFGWMYQSRVIWSLAMSVREREYIAAARFMGVRSIVIIVRHMIPNIGSLLIINLTLGIVGTVMSETGLSFLGLGVKLPDVSLGTLLSLGVSTLESAPWQFYFPAGVLTLLTVSVALIADGLRDALDPNSAAGGKA